MAAGPDCSSPCYCTRRALPCGADELNWLFVFASAAFNLIRLPKLLPRPT
jgi:hypothetical protein